MKTNDHAHSNSLLTDLYQLTMAYGYWKSKMEDIEAVFHLFFRSVPFGGRFCIACGLEQVIDYIDGYQISPSDIAYLSTLTGTDNSPLFDKDFLDYLSELKLSVDVFAVPEGTPVFPHQPMIRVQGSLIECQLIETALLNMINFQTLVATKSVRICHAAQDDPVLEFGLRRAQGADGAMSASRASYIGGCSGTSNVLAGKKFDIPVKGTMSHAWVMAFEDELSAFDKYSEMLPNNCVLLVDTYSTLSGVRNAVKAGKTLRKKGYELAGIRLDSGDLAYLSIEARKILDENGFPDTKITVSNELDERIIQSLKIQNARIDQWGVGTKLVTAYDQPALDGVYKLAALRKPGSEWQHKIKISEQSIKVTTPGVHQVRRYMKDDLYIGDVIYDINTNIDQGCRMSDPMDITKQKEFSADHIFKDLLVPIFVKGKKVYHSPPIFEIRRRVKTELQRLHRSIRRLINPHQYPVGVEEALRDLKTELTLKARKSK